MPSTSSAALSLGPEDTAGGTGTGGQQTPGPWDTPGHQPAPCLVLVLSPYAAVRLSARPDDRLEHEAWCQTSGSGFRATQLALGAPWLPGGPVLSPSWGALAGNTQQERPKCSCCSSGQLPCALIPGPQAGWDLKAWCIWKVTRALLRAIATVLAV